jgi:hypothetical protein
MPRTSVTACSATVRLSFIRGAVIPRKQRVANEPMMPRHCARTYPTFEPVPEHQVVSCSKALEKARELTEIVRFVGVADQNILAARRLDASHQRISITPLLDIDAAGARLTRDLNRPVRAPIVRHDDFAVDPVRCQCGLGLTDARPEGFPLVETRHHDGKLDRQLAVARPIVKRTRPRGDLKRCERCCRPF